MKTILLYPRAESTKYRELYRSLMAEGRKRGWRFVSVDRMPGPDEGERIRKICDDLEVDGWVGWHVGKPVSVALSGIPTVFVNPGHCPPGVPLVHHDNAAFGAAAAAALGFDEENYAVVGFAGINWSRARERAFSARLRENNLNCKAIRVAAPSFKPYAAHDELRRAISRLKRPVSVFAVNDSLADAVLASAESLGWHCPRDIRIVGCDDDELICMASPVTLSSVRPDWDFGGRLVASALEIQLRGEKPQREYVYGAAGVARRASTRTPYRRPIDERVERGLAFIAAEFASGIGVAEVVDKMGGSRRHCERRFREETGKSILETIEDKRMDLLQAWLGRKKANISALPRLCGFRSAAALRDFFRRRTGMSMTEWRKRERGNLEG